jgi:hypothetical protein
MSRAGGSGLFGPQGSPLRPGGGTSALHGRPAGSPGRAAAPGGPRLPPRSPVRTSLFFQSRVAAKPAVQKVRSCSLLFLPCPSDL